MSFVIILRIFFLNRTIHVVVCFSMQIANVNNCAAFEELLIQLGEKYSGRGRGPALAEVDLVKLQAVKAAFTRLAYEM